MTRFERLEASRLLRGGTDNTAPRTFVERVAPRVRTVAGDGLTFRFKRRRLAK